MFSASRPLRCLLDRAAAGSLCVGLASSIGAKVNGEVPLADLDGLPINWTAVIQRRYATSEYYLGMNYLFRLEKELEPTSPATQESMLRFEFPDDASTRRWIFQEWSRRSWRVAVKDQLVLTRGRNLELRFIAIGTVLDVRMTESRPPGRGQGAGLGYRYTLTVSVERLKEEPSLRQLMYSLEKVANFSLPGTNLPHHGLLSDHDVETIVSGQVDAERSIYFGLLQYLPERWREFADLTAQQMQARRSLDGESPQQRIRHESARRLPAQELLSSLHNLLINPIDLGAQASRGISGLGPRFAAPIVELRSDGNVDSWLGNVLNQAPRLASDMKKNYEVLDRQAKDLPYAEERRVWRPHRW